MNPLLGFEDEAIPLTNRQKVVLLRRHALHCKYEKAVELYADTDMSLSAIAEECNVPVGGWGITYGGTGVNWCCVGIRFRWMESNQMPLK